MTREDGVKEMRSFIKEHHESLIKGMDDISKALNKNDIGEVRRLVLKQENFALSLKTRAETIIEEVQRLENIKCSDPKCLVYDKEGKSGCSLDPLLRADCQTWKEVLNGDSRSTPDKG